MPHDPSQPGSATSPYILQEARSRSTCGKPLLLLAEPGVASRRMLVRGAFRGTAVPAGAGSGGAGGAGARA